MKTIKQYEIKDDFIYIYFDDESVLGSPMDQMTAEDLLFIQKYAREFRS